MAAQREGRVECLALGSRKAHGSALRWGARALASCGSPDTQRQIQRLRKASKDDVKAKSIWDDSAVRTEQGSIELRQLLGGGAPFPHPKPRALVERCLQLGSGEGEWVLDFFGGSGTTADAAISLERQGLAEDL